CVISVICGAAFGCHASRQNGRHMIASSAATLPPGPPRRAGLRLLRTLERDPLGLLEELRGHGTIAYARIGPQPVFLVNEPDLIEGVLLNNDAFNKARALERSKQLLGER